MSCAVEVSLRHPVEHDRQAYIAAVAESREFHSPWTRLEQGDEGFDTMLASSADAATETFLAFRASDQALVGYFRLSQIFFGPFCNAYLGYWANAAFAGQGYMTAGMKLLLQKAFFDVGLHRVEANVQPGNVKSIALLRRCGFRKEGFSPRYLRIDDVWRDHERWAITVEDVENDGA